MSNLRNELDPTELNMPSLTIGDVDLAQAVFIIPIDAPLPNEIADVEVPSGSLLTRLAALDKPGAQSGHGFDFVPLAGTELLSLERPWRALQNREHVYVLTELPGARYDVLFDQARRTIGLRSLDWPSVAAAMASHQLVTQRTTDKTPWATSRPGRGPRAATGSKAALPIPMDDGTVEDLE